LQYIGRIGVRRDVRVTPVREADCPKRVPVVPSNPEVEPLLVMSYMPKGRDSLGCPFIASGRASKHFKRCMEGRGKDIKTVCVAR